jgi:hypothetical protein
MGANIWTWSAAACVAAALVGCGDAAPGDGDVREAMAKQIEEISGKAGVDSQRDELAKIKVGKCVKADLGGFKCEFTAGGGTQTGRFEKGADGWALVGVGG